jgi:hypothetical protein
MECTGVQTGFMGGWCQTQVLQYLVNMLFPESRRLRVSLNGIVYPDNHTLGWDGVIA